MPELPSIKNIEYSYEVMTKLDIAEIKEVLERIERNELEIVKTIHQLKGNGQKWFGESIEFDVLYTCNVCMHQRKDNKVCIFDGMMHDQICPAFDKI